MSKIFFITLKIALGKQIFGKIDDPTRGIFKDFLRRSCCQMIYSFQKWSVILLYLLSSKNTVCFQTFWVLVFEKNIFI